MLNEFLIRLTNFCNETCDHCVFRSGPEFNTHMTPALASQINDWMPKIPTNISLLGGELTLIPNYPELIQILCKNLGQAGMITNGVFVRNDKEFDRFIDTIINLPIRRFTIRVSQSQYHTTQYGLQAYEKLSKIFEQIEGRWIQFAGSISQIIPFGRAFDNHIGYMPTHPTMIQDAMCETAMGNTTFIDEEGFAHLCPMGNSPYKHVSEDSYKNINYHIKQWQKHRIERGMTCLKCSRHGIGNHQQEIIPLRAKSTTSCASGEFNGVL